MPLFSGIYRRLRVAAAVAAAGLTVAPAASAGVFAPDSVWDAPLADGAPLVPGSSGLVAELRRQAGLPGGTWINTTSYSVPVYTVGRDQPRVKVTADTPYPPLMDAWASVPVPADAQPAAGSDAHMAIYQPATDTMWEFWAMYHAADGWHAAWGGRMDHVSENPGYFDGSYGATATGLPLLGGLIRPDEMAAGHIDHALALAIPQAERGAVVWPAQRGDGVATGANAIPEGTRFRIDPAVDIDALHLQPAARIIAKAIQRYGMIVRDQAGAVVLYAQDPVSLSGDPWPALFNDWPNHLLDGLPWQDMEAVTPSRAAFAVATPCPTPTPTPTPSPAPTTTPAPPPAAPTATPGPVATPTPVKPGPRPTGKGKAQPKAKAAAKRAARKHCARRRRTHARAACRATASAKRKPKHGAKPKAARA
jgi:hypothetical protein